MAQLHLVVCACCLGVAALVATGGGSSRRASGWASRKAVWLARELSVRLGAGPVVSALLGISSWVVASDALSWRLRHRGVIATRQESCAMILVAGLLGCLALGLLSRSPLGVVVGAFGVMVAVPLWESSRRRARERALIDEMPEVFRTLAMALGSGETLTQAIEYVGTHQNGYAGQAFVNTALRLRCGASTEEAMAELGRELEAPGVGLLTTALAIAQRTGSPLRGLFQSSAQLVERQGEYERMLAVKTAQVRLSVRIVCLLPLILVCMLSLISVDFQKGVGTFAGMASLAVAALMDGCALLIIRRMMRGVL